MATNSNTKQMLYQANSFNKGMDADTTDMLISDESYRLAKNLRYITDAGESTGELRLIEGAEEIEYSPGDSSDYLSEDYTVRAFNSMRNVGALVCQKEDGSWAVFRMDSDGSTWTTLLIFGWCADALSQDVKLSTVLKYEDADQLQLYIADGQHQLMKINLYDTTGSSDIKYVTNGSTFAKLKLVDVVQVLPGGQLTAGLVLYTYRLYNNNNTSTQISPLSGVKAITNTYEERGKYGLKEQQKSSMGLRISISIEDDIKLIFNKIQIYRISYLVNGLQPTISLISDEKLTEDSTFIYDDLGAASLQDLSVEEFNSLSGIYICPGVIESKNNILFAGNVKYDIDTLDEEYLNKDFRAFSSGDNVILGLWPEPNENKINTNLNFLEPYDETKWMTIKADANNIGGYGPNIEWRFGVYGSININDFPYQKNPNAEDLLVKNSSRLGRNKLMRGLLHDEIYRYGIILYSKNGTKYPVKWIADIRTPNINGTIGRELENNNTINTLSDLAFPLGSNLSIERSHILYPIFKIREEDDSGQPVLNSSKISGYEIVRVHRTINDRATIAQGIISSTVEVKDRKELSSSGMPFLDCTRYVNNVTNSPTYPVKSVVYFGGNYSEAKTDINVLLFYSPEISYQQDDIIQILKGENGAYLQCLYPVSSFSNDHASYSKATNGIVGDGIVLYNKDLNQYSDSYWLNNMYSTNNGSYHLLCSLSSHDQADIDIDGSGKFSSSSNATSLITVYDPIEKNHTRIKLYNAMYDTLHFLENTADAMYTDFNGLNVYKLHRSYNGMPDTIYDYENKQSVPINTNYNIVDYALIKSIDPNQLINGSSFNGKLNLSQVGDYTFFNCISPFIISHPDSFTIENLRATAGKNSDRDELIGTCDPSVAIVLDKDFIKTPHDIILYFYREENYGRGDTVSECEYSILCNIRRNIIPYGGFSKYSRDHSTYTQQGYFYDVSNLNEIEMFDGDTTISTFEFVPSHKWYNGVYTSPKTTIVCQVAVESVIDIEADCGERFSNNSGQNKTLVLVQPCNFNNVYIQKEPSYVYNTAYSIDPQLLQINYSLDSLDNALRNFDYRVHYSNPASNNQASDPWLIFQPLNYLDVDNSHGPITELRTFKDLLIFWQEKAMGVLSVNERVQIATDSNLPLILGTGGVLERYDYLTTANGMKENQHADTQSDHTLYWWDYDNNTICAYSRGSVPVQLSKVKSVQNILNRTSKDGKLTQSNISTGIYPLLTYDKKYNEVLFKIGQLEKLDKVGIHKGDTGLKDSDNDNVLVYNEQQAQFSSIYEIDPQCYFNIEQKLFFMNREDDKYAMYRWNSGNGEQSLGFNEALLLPYLKYVINNQKGVVKVYDNVEFAGRIPSGDTWDEESQRRSLYMSTLDKHVKFEFNTPLKQVGKIDGTKITNRQLDFKFAIPRNGYQDKEEWITKEYGDRMRGKTMQCEIYSDINSLDFSLLYILTKYRMSWG